MLFFIWPLLSHLSRRRELIYWA